MTGLQQLRRGIRLNSSMPAIAAALPALPAAEDRAPRVVAGQLGSPLVAPVVR